MKRTLGGSKFFSQWVPGLAPELVDMAEDFNNDGVGIADSIRFSRRIPRYPSANALSRLRDKLQAEGKPLLDLAGTNPTTCELGDWSERIADALRQTESARYLPEAPGSRTAREAIAARYAGQGFSVEATDVLLTASTSESYSFLFQLLCNPDDEVLIPAPSYPLLEHLASLAAVRPRSYPMWYAGEWLIDFAALEASLSQRTRAIVVVNPNNPTGSYVRRFEAEGLLSLCAAHGLVLIADEVFWDYSLCGANSHPCFASAATDAMVVSLGGLSKTAGMPQMKLGWMVLRGREEACKRMREGLRWIADSYLSVGAPVQAALPELLEIGAEVRQRIVERMHLNVATLQSWTADSGLATLLALEGGWSATLRLPETRSDHDWCESLLRKHHVWIQPGYFYDYCANSYVVVSLLTEPGTMREGLKRLSKEMV